ncbi:MAG: hypothetical protein WAM82_08035 [Thermoanaerobaculia bacterium]
MEPQSPPPPASPFNPVPRPVPQGGGGCSKPLVVGCIVIVLVGAIAVLGGIYYVGTHAVALFQWSLQQVENSLLLQLPKDVTPEEKANLQQAFADVRTAIQQGKVSPDRLQPLQFKIIEITRKGSGITRQDILDFTRSLQEVAGKPAPVGTPNPAPVETPAAGATPVSTT